MGRRGAVRYAVATAVAGMLCACGPPAPVPAPGPPAGEATAAPEPPPPPPVAEADRTAGLRGHDVPQSGAGETVPVPEPEQAPTPPDRERTVPMRVEIEQGIDVDGAAFASYVAAVLNDPRSWGGDGSMGFVHTEGPAPLQVLLVTPALADELCAPLDTAGRLSCRNGEKVVVNLERWVTGTPDYADDLTGYRRYLVNHEVGHWLGHRHEPCPGPGEPAPVMQQQTLGLDGCTPYSWPR
ncbi:DUF3152 domain-containing protein [Pseudonocardia nematodicida]|uniref:DUF3152 domain-containing protein n=1 Tax=Pseudonocardia nematodicida TaxID=1206997 RepID=A0ABV1K6P1_9PSEU